MQQELDWDLRVVQSSDSFDDSISYVDHLRSAPSNNCLLNEK